MQSLVLPLCPARPRALAGWLRAPLVPLLLLRPMRRRQAWRQP
jgi:hypothetical protein